MLGRVRGALGLSRAAESAATSAAASENRSSGSAARSDSTRLHTACPFHASVPTLGTVCALHECALVHVYAFETSTMLLLGFVAKPEMGFESLFMPINNARLR